MSRPRVSILTPSFNQAEWLAENLRSVALQTYADIEHVVMDGGSTDGSVELLEEAEGITWRSEPDNGQADAINKAFALSTGDIIGWINSDDAYVDGRVVADIVAFFEKHPGVDVAYGHCLQTAADGAVIQVLWAPRFDARLLGIVDFISQPAVFIRRRVLAEPMLDESFHFTLDYELWLRLASRGAVFARIPRILAVDRHQPERKSLTMLDIHAADSKRLSAMYGAAPAPTRFYLRQRVCGALLIPSIPAQLALSAPTDPLAGLWRRQLFSRKSTWPEEYR
ncbi:MAG: glycosyltransferase [Actinobacteria bacterium HGW-Actinobacteria-1]|jgi:glycosyltransferase involved in cell wall biosynthesis|nr:MAG: glycosyltransferase [Actinobacteria bacterium HGW-Actinobacteria-1]